MNTTSAMSLKFLQQLSEQQLPFSTSKQSDVDHIAILQAAHLIEATVPRMVGDQYVGSAIVTALTASGRAALAMAARDAP